MNRITDKELKAKVEHLNGILERYNAPGVYLGESNGWTNLHQTGSNAILESGTKREVFNFVRGMIASFYLLYEATKK